MKKMQYSERKFIIRGIFLPNSKISTHKREAERGCRERSSLLGFGAKPQAGYGVATPSYLRSPNREAIKEQESGSEAKPDSGQAALNRRIPRNPSPRTRPAGRLVRVVTPVPGCRVSLLVSMGVMGFLGDLGGEIEIFP